MKIETTMKITGDKELQKQIKTLGKKSIQALKVAMLKSAILVEGTAKENAPYRFGRLRASITHDPLTATSTTQKVGSDVEYAPWQEYGTAKMPAHPYLLPALKTNRLKILNIVKKAIKAVKP